MCNSKNGSCYEKNCSYQNNWITDIQMEKIKEGKNVDLICHHREYEHLEVIFTKTGLFPFCQKGQCLAVCDESWFCVDAATWESPNKKLWDKSQPQRVVQDPQQTALLPCSAWGSCVWAYQPTWDRQRRRLLHTLPTYTHTSELSPLPQGWSPTQGLGAQRSRSHSAAHLGGGGLVLGRALHFHANTSLTYPCNVYWVLCPHPPRSFGTNQCVYVVMCFRSALSTEFLSLTPTWPKAELGSHAPITPQDAHSSPLK